MQTKKWMIIGSIVAVVLIAAILLVPMVFAQGPATGNNFVPGRGSMMNNGLGTNYGMDISNTQGGWQGRGMRQQTFMQGQNNGSGFVDQDGDGVCDTCGNGAGRGPGFIDEDGDGMCDNFVDEDGDGICDNAGTGGQGPGFVDEDGDGVCDHLGTGQQGARRGGGMGRWTQ